MGSHETQKSIMRKVEIMRELKIEDEVLTTRNKARKLVEKLENSDVRVLDLSDVEFMSRSFADEFFNGLSENVDLKMTQNLEKMRNIVLDSNIEA